MIVTTIISSIRVKSRDRDYVCALDVTFPRQLVRAPDASNTASDSAMVRSDRNSAGADKRIILQRQTDVKDAPRWLDA